MATVEAIHARILPGDWWFIRQQRIPLTPARIEEKRSDWLRRNPNKRPTAWTEDVSLGEVSEKAAKFCFRLHSMHLAGVRQLLVELQTTGGDVVLTDRHRAIIRKLLDVPQGKEWTNRFKRDLDRWTLDFLYKMGMVRGVHDPAPPLLDWASSMTWITMCQSEIFGGSLPLKYFLYTVCAMQLCSQFKPFECSHHQNGTDLSRLLQHDNYADWQVRALQHAVAYLDAPRPLLSQDNLKELRWLVFHERREFFNRAFISSDAIRETLLEWEILL